MLYSSWKLLCIQFHPSYFVAYPYWPACLLAYLLFYEKVFHCSSLPLNSEDVVLHVNKEKGMKFECHSYLFQNVTIEEASEITSESAFGIISG